MNNKQVIQEMLSLIEFPPERLVEFAENDRGFMGDEGAYGLSYPHDISDYEIENEGRASIPAEMVEVHYWDNGEKSIIVPLNEYIQELKIFLTNKREHKLAKRIDDGPILKEK